MWGRVRREHGEGRGRKGKGRERGEGCGGKGKGRNASGGEAGRKHETARRPVSLVLWHVARVNAPSKEKTGWKTTRVSGLRWPVRVNFSGGRGIQSTDEVAFRTGAAASSSWSCASCFSMSITCRDPAVVRGGSNRGRPRPGATAYGDMRKGKGTWRHAQGQGHMETRARARAHRETDPRTRGAALYLLLKAEHRCPLLLQHARVLLLPVVNVLEPRLPLHRVKRLREPHGVQVVQHGLVPTVGGVHGGSGLDAAVSRPHRPCSSAFVIEAFSGSVLSCPASSPLFTPLHIVLVRKLQLLLLLSPCSRLSLRLSRSLFSLLHLMVPPLSPPPSPPPSLSPSSLNASLSASLSSLHVQFLELLRSEHRLGRRRHRAPPQLSSKEKDETNQAKSRAESTVLSSSARRTRSCTRPPSPSTRALPVSLTSSHEQQHEQRTSPEIATFEGSGMF